MSAYKENGVSAVTRTSVSARAAHSLSCLVLAVSRSAGLCSCDLWVMSGHAVVSHGPIRTTMSPPDQPPRDAAVSAVPPSTTAWPCGSVTNLVTPPKRREPTRASKPLARHETPREAHAHGVPTAHHLRSPASGTLAVKLRAVTYGNSREAYYRWSRPRSVA